MKVKVSAEDRLRRTYTGLLTETADTALGIPKDRSWLPLLGSGVPRVAGDKTHGGNVGVGVLC